jgi:glutamate-1-semialdehyde 2,1-aminomutase
LAARFGLPYWQFATTATDANRFALKMARAATGRRMIVVFDGCYHGSLDETLVTVENGVVRASAENMAPAIDPAETTRVVPFNDIDALRAALAPGDVACVLCEPALTNSGLVFPRDGFHDAMRAVTREHGVLLVIDETHTICAGPGGATRAFGLDPDIVTLGKPLAGGIPAATYGFTAALAEAIGDWTAGLASFVTGVTGTLSGNALGMAAMRAALERVMTEDAYARMTAQAARLADGTCDIIVAHGLPWGVGRLGARVEYRFYPGEPANAAEAADHPDDARDALFRLFFLNRGILLTIFYNVALVAPQVEPGDIDRHNEIFAEFAALWTGLQR